MSNDINNEFLSTTVFDISLWNSYQYQRKKTNRLMVMMKIDLFYVFRPCFVPTKFWELRFNLLSLNCLLMTPAVKRARQKSLLVGDKERENRERGTKKKLYHKSNGISAN
jgi:hypothetical protein